MANVKQGRAFLFTINNPTEAPVFPSGCQYAYQLEQGEQGTKHYQGYVVFSKQQRLSALSKLLPRAHWENRKGTHEQALAYVTKEDTRLEPPVSTFVDRQPGARSDLSAARSIVLGKRSWAEVVQDPEIEEVLAKYPKFVREVFQHKPPVLLEGVALRPWQQDLMDKLNAEPDPRKIMWVYDPVGNTGKSFMARYLASNHGAQVFSSGKSADIAYAMDSSRIIVWDLHRAIEEHVNYGVMEDVKNGVIFSSKYESCTKVFPIPHVVVFSNFMCPSGKFSDDRLSVIDLSPPVVVTPTSVRVAHFRKPCS